MQTGPYLDMVSVDVEALAVLPVVVVVLPVALGLSRPSETWLSYKSGTLC